MTAPTEEELRARFREVGEQLIADLKRHQQGEPRHLADIERQIAMTEEMIALTYPIEDLEKRRLDAEEEEDDENNQLLCDACREEDWEDEKTRLCIQCQSEFDEIVKSALQNFIAAKQAEGGRA